MPTSRRSRGTPSSTPPTRRCSAAGGSTAPHRAAGPGLKEESGTLGGCPTGEARITAGHALRARHVIHAVGPVWRGGAAGEDGLLASCYRASLILAVQHRIAIIAFPAISTGVYGFPAARAAAVALAEVRAHLAAQPLPEEVIFCCFGAHATAIMRAALGAAPP